MKKGILVSTILCLFSVSVFAGPFSKFNEIMDSATKNQAQHYLDSLASDLGNIMTGSNFGVSAGLGLANVNLNLKVNYNKVSNTIMKRSGTSKYF